MILMSDQDVLLLRLVEKAKDGDTESFEQILKILDPEIQKMAKNYYIVGSDDQDVVQECRIGVWKAIKDFDENGGMNFRNFSLNLCCKRHLITAISHANTQKFKLQNEAVSLSAPISHDSDEGVQTYADYIEDPQSDLMDSYIAQEEFEANLDLVADKLTRLEFSIFGQYAYNSSYKDIADALNVKPKTVDNALMRIRKKASEAYKQYTESFETVGVCSIRSVNEEQIISNFVGIGSFTCV